ncbi:baseplate J/gp47 family protein [Gluconacetobacter entanii]|uniref:baseplate J/gp47 family protein n=1 Tax=Gluconacetobacter entanii TaxID=108528 RepID=UPI001C9366DE|nr:baseplate J/gp47 family protein [Gluconacetobacter entanii]MBY4641564.1 baseplate J/gp47 family protein [Gluconacetobacter entanii]MCW4582037.1 baseplate J/gp47 family protein [Gluconacetobacter entanii]MCW4585221.1 baseplate J/gp47 family protein [Gluconacetobacter entanii]MCW4588798.1 baseplate J/gp47 family protein [Gluconacetobacter entanii]
MAYPRPTLSQLRQQALQDVISGGIPGVTAVLRFSVLYVLSMVLAGLTWLQYGYIDWVSLQSVPWTATDEFLEGWGTLKGVYRKAATAASGTATFPATGTDIIPAGTGLILLGGAAATASADSVTSGGVTTVSWTADTTGTGGNVAVGTTVTLSSPVAGIQTSGTVTAVTQSGADVEDEDDYRTRVIDAYQAQGQDGKEQDYVDWAEAVPGVTRVWPLPNGLGSGTVVVFFMMDKDNAATGGFPVGTDGCATSEDRYTTATGDQLTVANAIKPQQPVTALVIAATPVAQPTDFVITDLGTGNTAANQAAITTALTDMFRRLSSPGGKISPNNWEEAISPLGLETFEVASPTGPVMGATASAMPTLGVITFPE